MMGLYQKTRCVYANHAYTHWACSKSPSSAGVKGPSCKRVLIQYTNIYAHHSNRLLTKKKRLPMSKAFVNTHCIFRDPFSATNIVSFLKRSFT